MPLLDGHHLEPHTDVSGLRVAREPHLSRATDPPSLLCVHRADRAAEAPPLPLLDLDEREITTSPDDEIDLVSAGADVCPEDPIAAQAVVPECPPFTLVQAAAGSTA